MRMLLRLLERYIQKIMGEQHKRQVDWFVKMYQDWLLNLQKDANAHGTVIPVEVIADAFAQLRDYYNILDEDTDMDKVIKKFFEGE